MDENKENNQPIIIKKIKKGGHGGHHGGAWKVAYADFVTAMMALFIVLWILSASTEVQMKITAYFEDPGAFSFVTGKRTVPIDGGMKPLPGKKIDDQSGDASLLEEDLPEGMSLDIYQELKTKARKDSVEAAKLLDEMGSDIEEFLSDTFGDNPETKELVESLKFTMTDEGLQIDLIESKESLFFEIGSATLKVEGKKILDYLAKEIGKLPNSVEIQGHTDSRKYSGSSSYTNWDLSSDRANSTRRYMELKGLWKGQIDVVSGYADKKLLNKENPFSNENRRVSILVKYIKSNEFLETELSKIKP